MDRAQNGMLAIERRQTIVKWLEERRVVSVADLSDQLGVSVMTIRRDLKELEDQGILSRTHGGAVYGRSVEQEPNYSDKQIIQERQKTLIARYAALNFIENKDTFILEGGTTVTLMSQFLDNFRELTIITNGLYTATETANLVPYHTVICTGGILRERARTFVGPLAENTFKHFHPRTAFLSATGWTPELGFTDPNLLETAVKRAMLASAQRIVVLLDSSKFGTRSLITSIQTNEVHVVITDSQADRIAVETMRAKGLDVRIVTE